MASEWLVIQALDSRYRDVEGREYHYPTNIPQGRRLAPGDVMVVARPTRDAPDGRRVVGIGRIGQIQQEGASERRAVYDRYVVLDPPVSFEDIGGDPRKNRSNSINPISGEVVAGILERIGIPSVDQLPVVTEQARNSIGAELNTVAADDIRKRLLEATRLDLLGPAEGPEEEILTSNLRDRYLLGQLLPRGLPFDPAAFDSAAKADGGPSEDGSTEGDTPASNALLPSSIGVTFCVTAEADEIAVVAEWGRYERVKSDEHQTKSGSQRLVWKRRPSGGAVAVALTEGQIEPLSADAASAGVVIQGTVRRSSEGDWLVTLFLVNGQAEPEQHSEEAWLFQPRLEVTSPDNSPVFRRRPTLGTRSVAEEMELRLLDMQYRDHVEFAVGHGVSVHATVDPENPTRASSIETTFMPTYDVPATESVSEKDRPGLSNLTLDMKVLSELSTGDLATTLGVLPAEYEKWLEEQEERITSGELKGHEAAARVTLQRAREALARLYEGITVLEGNEQAAEAFRFANRAMWRQRIRSEYALRKRRGEEAELHSLDSPENRTWYPFQLGFLLLTIPGLVDPTREDRTHNTKAIADLLWFPTGGGKTEAYFGVAAFVMGLRRLQSTLGDLDGSAGVAVIMRYTLRLLTIQQFQRASALICAMEVIRREAIAAGDPKWGIEPFRIGLWLGARATPNSTSDSKAAIRNIHGDTYHNRGTGTPYQLTSCPWCGQEIKPGRDLKVDDELKRTLMFCSDPLGQCAFSKRQAPTEGIPAVVVDEEIYRLLPTLMIGTVDKFAQMPWKGEVQTLFGRVRQRCPRHGYLNPESDCSGRHPKRGDLPRTEPLDVTTLRPPDLIIQDELHLISGPLGTMVGLYETAVDELCEWELNGKTVRPKVIASTATIRRAKEQVHALFLRDVHLFPPRGLDASDNFFAKQRPISEQHPGRRYFGICAPGKSRPSVLIRVYVALLTAAKALFEEHGAAADPWMTLLGYFNSLRELGGMRRLVEDDVSTRTLRVIRDPDLLRPGLDERVLKVIDELTSRKASADIPKILDHLEVPFDPDIDEKRKRAREKKEPLPPLPIDVILATNMVSVGVDVRRLGLMVVAGQPKTTAEYIQATSRVGRAHPGLVCTVLNWARPRDLSHYERFEHYHSTFYQYVEALSVTPYASRALDRGLSALLVAMLRLQQYELTPNEGAGLLQRTAPYNNEVIEEIGLRAWNVTEEADTRTQVHQTLTSRLDQWSHEAQVPGRTLGYKSKGQNVVALLRPPGPDPWGPFTILNSLRDVEPAVNLILHESHASDEPSWESKPDEGGES